MYFRRRDHVDRGAGSGCSPPSPRSDGAQSPLWTHPIATLPDAGRGPGTTTLTLATHHTIRCPTNHAALDRRRAQGVVPLHPWHPFFDFVPTLLKWILVVLGISVWTLTADCVAIVRAIRSYSAFSASEKPFEDVSPTLQRKGVQSFLSAPTEPPSVGESRATRTNSCLDKLLIPITPST